MITIRASVLLAVSLFICTGCSKGEPPMSSAAPKTLSAFTSLSGGFSQAIAPGGQLVTLNSGAGATWWEGDRPVTAELPPNIPVDGARWTADGKSLRVGLGTIDFKSRAWRADPALASWGAAGPQGQAAVREAAWFSNTLHVALLLETRTPQGKRTTEVVVISAADGKERGRRELEGATALIASDDRVLVAAKEPVVLDLDANVVATPSSMPLSVTRVREGAGMFAALGAAGDVALIRPADGVVVATWDVNAVDVVPVPKGAVAVDFEGNVRVGCLQGNALRNVGEGASGVSGAVIQLVDSRIVVAGAGADPVRVSTFTNPCR
ncbi:MAG: hypothetical protein H0T89_17770 [Deltaproteobacteria bacterium]|nr:hypothetical protein [Deltaproteobacteria bacterium]MDQ3301468.1 hypothetical protein [Myxococcota bacterium]